MNERQQFGRQAERHAQRYLVERGWHIVAVNQRIGRGELDIIARKGGVLAFVEVKARRTSTCGSPEDAVTAQKQRQIRQLADLWLGARPSALRGVTDVRFDVIAVDWSRRPVQLRHLAGAFG